jgi:hypothetical protein
MNYFSFYTAKLFLRMEGQKRGKRFQLVIEMLAYTPQEFEGMVERENSFLTQVLEYGIDILT